MRTVTKDRFCSGQRIDPVEGALEILMFGYGTTSSESLECCVDQIELTKMIGKLAASLDILVNGLSLDSVIEKYRSYELQKSDLSEKFIRLTDKAFKQLSSEV